MSPLVGPEVRCHRVRRAHFPTTQLVRMDRPHPSQVRTSGRTRPLGGSLGVNYRGLCLLSAWAQRTARAEPPPTAARRHACPLPIRPVTKASRPASAGRDALVVQFGVGWGWVELDQAASSCSYSACSSGQSARPARATMNARIRALASAVALVTLSATIARMIRTTADKPRTI